MSIGDKLKEFGIKKFGNVKSFAEALGMKPPSLYNYFNNESKPGAEFLAQLMDMGCDINWLLGSSAKAIIKEPKLEYRVKELEEENKELELQNEQLRKSIEAASGVLNYKVKNKRRRK